MFSGSSPMHGSILAGALANAAHGLGPSQEVLAFVFG
jgi:hypothetical protein